MLVAAAGAAVLLAGSAEAQAVQPPPAGAADDSSTIVITARRLSQARASIQPQVGASTYSINAQAIQALPGGENAPLNQVVLQAPGAVQDSFGQLHIRGEHNGLQFRLNGVILPEGLSVFSQALSRIAALGTPVILTSGNHDSAARVGFGTELIAAAGVHLRTDLSRVAEPVLLAEIDVNERDIRSQRFHKTEGVVAARTDADDGDALLLEESTGGVEEVGAVVDDQTAERPSRGCEQRSWSNRSTRRRKPPPDRDAQASWSRAGWFPRGGRHGGCHRDGAVRIAASRNSGGSVAGTTFGRWRRCEPSVEPREFIHIG